MIAGGWSYERYNISCRNVITIYSTWLYVLHRIQRLMIDFLLRFYTGTLHHIQGIDNIVDLAIFIVASGVCLFVAAITCGIIIVFLSGVYEEIMK